MTKCGENEKDGQERGFLETLEMNLNALNPYAVFMIACFIMSAALEFFHQVPQTRSIFSEGLPRK